mmetsp:Transcript_116770/g.162112  ORF Transcript_116770/g.162112 Transcript_116770/m.162112 type:complete len:281 (-) Transcript_116770:132-974(-)
MHHLWGVEVRVRGQMQLRQLVHANRERACESGACHMCERKSRGACHNGMCLAGCTCPAVAGRRADHCRVLRLLRVPLLWLRQRERDPARSRTSGLWRLLMAQRLGHWQLRDLLLLLLLLLVGAAAKQAKEVAPHSPLEHGVEQEVHWQVLQRIGVNDALLEQGRSQDLEERDGHASGVREGDSTDTSLAEILRTPCDHCHELAQRHATANHEQREEQEDPRALDELRQRSEGILVPHRQHCREELQRHQQVHRQLRQASAALIRDEALARHDDPGKGQSR